MKNESDRVIIVLHRYAQFLSRDKLSRDDCNHGIQIKALV